MPIFYTLPCPSCGSLETGAGSDGWTCDSCGEKFNREDIMAEAEQNTVSKQMKDYAEGTAATELLEVNPQSILDVYAWFEKHLAQGGWKHLGHALRKHALNLREG